MEEKDKKKKAKKATASAGGEREKENKTERIRKEEEGSKKKKISIMKKEDAAHVLTPQLKKKNAGGKTREIEGKEIKKEGEEKKKMKDMKVEKFSTKTLQSRHIEEEEDLHMPVEKKKKRKRREEEEADSVETLEDQSISSSTTTSTLTEENEESSSSSKEERQGEGEEEDDQKTSVISTEEASTTCSSSPPSSASPPEPSKNSSSSSLSASAPSDPYLLAEADYLRNETRWVNRQRVLILASRGITHIQRHLMEDFKKLLPHHKAESKWERKQTMKDLAELAELRACNNVLYFESRKRDLLLHMSKIPHGPTVIFRVLNIHTLAELSMTGNCLLHSRPLLLFSPDFGTDASPDGSPKPHLALIKELLIQIFGTPRNHPKAKPFFDHAMAFYRFDGDRLWFRHYQITPLVGGDGGDADNPERQTFVEIGPRCVFEVVKILEGSFSGKVLWSNEEFIPSRDLAALHKLRKAEAYGRRLHAKEQRAERFEKSTREHEESPLSFESVFGDFVKERISRETTREKNDEEEEESGRQPREKKNKIKKTVHKKRKIT